MRTLWCDKNGVWQTSWRVEFECGRTSGEFVSKPDQAYWPVGWTEKDGCPECSSREIGRLRDFVAAIRAANQSESTFDGFAARVFSALEEYEREAQKP